MSASGCCSTVPRARSQGRLDGRPGPAGPQRRPPAGAAAGCHGRGRGRELTRSAPGSRPSTPSPPSSAATPSCARRRPRGRRCGRPSMPATGSRSAWPRERWTFPSKACETRARDRDTRPDPATAVRRRPRRPPISRRMPFDKALEELRGVVARLEAGWPAAGGVDRALRARRRPARALRRSCSTAAELRVQRLVDGAGGGAPRVMDLRPDDGDDL